jgi:hypothetical protein
MKGTAASPARDLMAERYGRRPGRRLLAVVVGAVLVVAGLVWLVWAVWLESTPQVQSGLVRSNVAGPHRVSAVVAVSFGSRHTVASCLLQAMAADHSVVGELNFRVGPSADEHLTVHRSMRTERPAATINLVGCTTPEQKRPR